MLAALSAWVTLVFWLCSLPYWEGRTAPAAVQGALFACASVCALVARPRPTARLPRRAAWFGLAFFAMPWLLPWPFGMFGPPIALGLLCARRPGTAWRSAGTALTLLGVGIATGGAFVLLYIRFFAGIHSVYGLSTLVGRCLAWAGLPGAPLDGTWTVRDIHNLSPLLLSPESLGLHAGALFGAALLPSLLWRARPARGLMICLAVGGVYLVLRQVLLAGLILSTGDPSLAWRAGVVALSFLPLALLLGALLPARRPDEPVREASAPTLWSERPGFPRAAFASLGTLVLWGAIVDIGPEVPSAGRVLIDEHHSDWERTDEPMGTSDYSPGSTYNYSSMLSYLDAFYDVKRNEAMLDDDVLRAVDVLVIKTPTEAYSEEEIEAVERFVRRGGGLFLVGDHTNVFGTSLHLNHLAECFGIRFEYDATYDLATGGLSLYHRPRVLAHPAVAQLPPFLFATSCSLRGPAWARSIQTGGGLMALPLDYSKQGFFADKDQGWLFFPFGLFDQCLSVGHGRGRVVAFSDSTVWSNFFMFVPGKPELALGLIEWLNHNPRFPGLRLFLFLGALGLLGVGALGGNRRDSGGVLPHLILPILLTSGAALPLLTSWEKERHPLPTARRDLADVAFLGKDCDFFLPSEALIPDGSPSYLTFFNCVQRVGLTPRYARTFDDLEGADLVVVLRREKPFDADELDRLESWIRSGGRVLVLSDESDAQAVSSLLARAGLAWQPRDVPRSALAEGEEEAEGDSPVQEAEPVWIEGRPCTASVGRWANIARTVTGGESWITDARGDALLAKKTVGKGILVVGAIAGLFENDVIEDNTGSPSPEQLELYGIEYSLLRGLVERASF